MLKINITKEEFDALPDALKAEYAESNGSYSIQVEGMKAQSDIDAIKSAKDQAKREQKEAQDALKEALKEKNSLLDKVNAYESDENRKLGAEERIEFERVKRELESKATEFEDLNSKYAGIQSEVTTSKIKNELIAASKGVIRDDAVEDTVNTLLNRFVISDNKVLTSTELGDKSGLEAKTYLSDYVKDRSYLAPASSGGGAGGGQGSGGRTLDNRDEGRITVFQDLNK